MAFAPQKGDAQVSLSVFGGLVTEMVPPDLPEGVSPDCQDVVFVPGSVASRPALRKVFADPFPQGGIPNLWPTVTYAKSFVTPTGGIENLYLDSFGNLWWEDVTNTPGTYSQISAVAPSAGILGAPYAKSITAFGREYLAFSDGQHGQEVPMQWDGTNLDRVTQDGPGTPPTVASVPIAPSTISTIARNNNVATVVTTGAHGLKVGYQAQIAAVPTDNLASISGIVISNTDLPGIATITCGSPHGLAPGVFVSLVGIPALAIGGGVASISRQGGIVNVTTNAAHNLSPGAVVTFAGVTDGTFNATMAVSQVTGPTTFVCLQADTRDTTSVGAGTISLAWPIPETSNPTYFQIIATPSSTTFQVQVNYSDWPGAASAGGTVNYPWNGTFFVASVPSTTSFTYQHVGRDHTTFAPSAGTVTPFGQLAPGIHQCQVLFLTRAGYTTRPSPPVQFTANGGEYLTITNIPIGPANVVARILAFTGAGGAYFYYIPAPAQANGQQISTSTQINDNTTTSVTLDFADATLMAATGISIPGNDLASQIILDSALGFGFYGSRLLAWGMRNRIQNLLNMGFEGGHLSGSVNPLGWTVSGAGGRLFPLILGGGITRPGNAWNIGSSTITQPCYQDAYGAPILTPLLKYRFRALAYTGIDGISVTISSATSGFSSTATIPLTVSVEFVEVAFSAAMPSTIPADMVLSISGVGFIDEMSIIYDANPYLDTVLYGSYVNNPEGFDGVTGKFGPSQDTHTVLDLGTIRNTLYLLTQDPGGRLHQTSDNGVTEPAGWSIHQVGANCGLLSAFSLTKSQADDSSASGGEEWLAWASSSGARIFGGDQPWKISQEIQPDWEAILPQYRLSAWALNDPVSRTIYFGVPLTGASSGAPNKIYVLSYRELDTAYQIATNGPIRTSFSGRLIATDHTRKWTRWTMTMNGAALMYRQAGQLQPVFFGGNGQPPGAPAGFDGPANVFTLDPAYLTDDYFGQIYPYYVTYFAPQHDSEIQMQLGGGRKLLAYFSAFISGFGTVKITPLCDSLTNPWAITASRPLSRDPKYDLEWGGGNAQAQRIAFKFESSPMAATDNSFNLQKLTAWMRPATHLRIRGSV